MLWFYSRADEALRAETRVDRETSEFVLVVHWPDGRSNTERFSHIDAFRTRLIELQHELQAQRWEQDGPPLLIPDGWPKGPVGGPLH